MLVNFIHKEKTILMLIVTLKLYTNYGKLFVENVLKMLTLGVKVLYENVTPHLPILLTEHVKQSKGRGGEKLLSTPLQPRSGTL